MHDIWNPWHGCKKCSEGRLNCYMYYNDAKRGRNGADIYRTKTGFRYPLSKNRSGQYKVKSGEMIRVCMNSDFFLEAEHAPVIMNGSRLFTTSAGNTTSPLFSVPWAAAL